MIELKVNGKTYAGWKRATIMRGIESISGAFDLEVTDRWAGQDTRWPIYEEDECAVSIDGTTVITGYVDRRSLSYSASDRSMSVSGRDKAGVLVDCSAVLDSWEFKKIPLQKFVEKVCAPFGIDVAIQSGLTLPTPLAKLSIDPGDTAHEVIEKACRLAGVLPVSDGQGGLVLTRTGSGRCKTQLVEGKNILAASADYDASDRFYTYLVMGQHAGSDELYGESAAQISAFAEDTSVKRVARTLVIRPEGNTNQEYAKRRAQWEAKVRAARADAVTVTVQGWTQSDGSLWPLNAVVPVHSPSIGVDGDLLITQALHTLDEGGTVTELTLRRPDAFKPEPTVKRSSGGLWKEIAAGV